MKHIFCFLLATLFCITNICLAASTPACGPLKQEGNKADTAVLKKTTAKASAAATAAQPKKQVSPKPEKKGGGVQVVCPISWWPSFL